MIEFPSSSTILWTIAFLAVTAFGDHHSRDFHFENDKVVLFSEAYNPQDKSFSSSSISCPYSEGKLVLALLLKDKNWEVILPRKRDRAISKLTKFFSIVKEDLMLDDVTKHELHEMNKKSLHHGKNQINLSKKIGRLEFVIGCGKQYSTAGRLIANQIGHQIKEKSIDDISGLEFGWWVIYTKNVNNKTPRSRRQASEDGSGADEEDEYFEDYEEPITETPVQSTTHAHRHQHGLENDDEDYDASTDNVESEFDTDQKLPDTGGASSSSSSSTVVTSTKQEQPNQHQQEHHEYEQLPSSSSTTTATTSTTTTTTNQEIINNNELLSTVMPLITTDSDVSMIPTTSSSSSSSLPAAAVTFSSIAFNNNGDDDYDETHVVSSESETAGSSSFTSPHESVTIFTTFTTTTTTTTTITNTQATTSSSTSDNADSVESQTIVEDQNESTSRVTSTPTPEEDNYDDEYDDNYDEANAKPKSSSTTSTPEFSEEDVIPNNPPRISNRLPKIPVTAGKPFKILVPENTFADAEDENRLTLELLDSHNNPLKSNSWIQFNAVRGEIYGLPLDEATSKYQYHLRATDSGNESVIETIDIHVQQHKGHRTVNHEIEFNVRLNEKFERNIDWQLKLIDAIRTVLATSVSDIVVREVRQHTGDIHAYSFVYTNDSLPGEHCPEEELEELSERIYIEDLNRTLGPGIIVKSVVPRLVGNCKKVIPKPKSTMVASKNYPPLPRNQVDRVNATVGQLLVFRVPADTFYDPEDETDLKLSLLEMNRTKIEPQNWLQFDSKNREFYGLPKLSDVGQKDYMLVAEDREGLSTADALLVVVSASAKRDYGVMFDFNLGIPYESFNSSSKQRRFIENVAKIFQDNDLSHILVRQIRRQGHNVTVSWHNTTLHRHHHRCPSQEINRLREILMHPDSNVRDRVKETLGDEFNLVSVNIVNVGACHGADTLNHEPPMKPDEPLPRDTDDYLLTFVLPAVIILAMLLLASIVACVLHRRRLTGKMELGDEEERKSFRNKGIPVIFQDELDEKPDIASKSPIILKEEKPALLPPTYNGINPEGENDDLDEYVPPPGVGPINNRETRGKSPVTPSYRRPPPYVSP